MSLPWLLLLLPAAAAEAPCDIFAKGGTPCVAAHSMTRALYATYAGPLYSLKKGSSTTDIKVVSAGGVVDTGGGVGGNLNVEFCQQSQVHQTNN